MAIDEPARDKDGVAVAAGAVARAASSSEQPLPEELCDRFEPSLDTDLSDVRSHTGRASATAAEAVALVQQSIGNRAVNRLLAKRSRPQTATSQHDLNRRDENDIAPGADLAVEISATSPGAPLPLDLLARFESSLDADLSHVRIHTGRDSAKAADAVGARAYTVGKDVHFGAGYYEPSSASGIELLAHEVAHTVQQPAGAPGNRLEVSRPGDGAEVEADQAAGAIMRGDPAVMSQHPLAILRDKGDQKKPDATPAVFPQVIPIELNLESKGPKSEGYVKMNKAYLKLQGKLTDSNQPAEGGAVNVGPSVGGKSSDGKNSGQVGVTAEAKKSAQTFLNKEFDAMVNSLVKSVTGKDDAVKTELFAKAKAEAKAGSKEGSIKIGYDFGVDATIFGVGKVTAQVKFTLAGLKYKPSEKPPVSATVLAADFSQKFAVKRKKAFEVGGSHYDIEGSADFGAEFEPNWEKIALDAAKNVGRCRRDARDRCSAPRRPAAPCRDNHRSRYLHGW